MTRVVKMDEAITAVRVSVAWGANTATSKPLMIKSSSKVLSISPSKGLDQHLHRRRSIFIIGKLLELLEVPGEICNKTLQSHV